MNNTKQTTSNDSLQAYIGRFAPSPSGPLHFGSLVAAVASYLDARHRNGQWLVRIDDIDPPREVPGATDTILHQLQSHQLHWDGEMLYQSHRNDAYQEAIEQLNKQQLIYPCDCSRQGIKAMGGHYNGHCRYRQSPPKDGFAWRLHIKAAAEVAFTDLFQGGQNCSFNANGNDDFIVRRRDQFFAYQLVCAVDDLQQGISHIIRGSDLLDSTPRQRYLMKLLQPDAVLPEYGHIPVAIGNDGQKLSKQNLAMAIDPQRTAQNIRTALEWLHHSPPKELHDSSASELLAWAIEHWYRGNIPQVMEIAAPGQL